MDSARVDRLSAYAAMRQEAHRSFRAGEALWISTYFYLWLLAAAAIGLTWAFGPIGRIGGFVGTVVFSGSFAAMVAYGTSMVDPKRRMLQFGRTHIGYGLIFVLTWLMWSSVR